MSREIEIEKINSSTWRISEVDKQTENAVDAYLLCGTKRALLVDTLMFTKELYGEVRKLTSLPIDVILTHGHIDHVGLSLPTFYKNGCEIFMDIRDLFLVENSNPIIIDCVKFTNLYDGQLFELGDRTVEIISVPGHTPGSVVALDWESELAFTGDTIGSGHFWMQLPEALSLDIFEKNLSKFSKQMEQFNNLIVYPGHKAQSPVLLTGQYIKDTLKFTQDIIYGDAVGEDSITEYMNEKIACKVAGYGLMICYSYNPLNIHS